MSKRLNITLPEDAYNLLEADAKRNCRSLSEEITYMILTHKGENAEPKFMNTIR